jgi:voltage-gated potassium channel
MSVRVAKALANDAQPYDLFMLGLCICALALLGAEATLTLDSSTSEILQYADNFLCVLFLGDFVRNLVRAPDRRRYLVTWGWIDVLSSLPAFEVFRIGRAARVFRVLRVLRAMKSSRAVAHMLIAKRAESATLTTIALSLLLVMFSSVAILRVEMPVGGNIQSAEDAAWWAISTMTTVGYGDRYPLSSEGRLIAILLMAAGVGVFGTLSGAVAGWFLSPAAKESDEDAEEIKQLLRDVQRRLAHIERRDRVR